MLKKLLLITLLISTPAISVAMCCELTTAPGSPYTIEASPPVITNVEPNDLAILSRVCNLLVVSTQGGVFTFTISADCSLETGQVIPVPARSVAFSPIGNCLAVGRADGLVTIYAINPNDCTIDSNGTDYPTTNGSAVVRVRFTSDGQCLAAVLADSTDIFAVNDDGCSLSPIPANFNTGSTTQDAAFFPNRNCLVISQTGPARISVFPVIRDAEGNCMLNTAASVSYTEGLANPRFISFSPNGNCLTVGNTFPSSTGVAVYTVQEGIDNCALSYVSQLLSSSAVPSAVFSPVGNCLVAANLSASVIQIFAVDSDSCTFTIGETISISPALIPSVLAYLGFTADGRCLAFTGPDLVQETDLSMYSTNIIAPPVITQVLSQQCNITVMGTTAPGLSVQVFVDGSSVGDSVAVGPSGMFEVTVGPLLPGMHSITAIATNLMTGCSSEFSNAVGVIITAGPTITNIQTTCLNTVIVSGTAVPGIPVSILVDDNPTPIGMGLPNDAGIFTIATQPVVSGSHCFIAVQAGCPSAMPMCVNVGGQSCVLGAPNLAFGTHCNV